MDKPIHNVAVYFRYSSDKDAQKENSERRQKDDISAHCYKNGYNIVWEDGDEERPGWQEKPHLNRLKEEVENGLNIDALVVTEFSRLTRKDSMNAPSDLGWLAENGIALILVYDGGTPIDLTNNIQLLLLQMKVFLANEEVKNLAGRVSSGMKSKFKSGDLGWSRVPFGFDAVKEKRGDKIKTVGIKPNNDLIHVYRMFQTMLDGGSIGDCLIHLQKGSRYRAGSNATGTSVKNILRNAIYCGKRTFGVSNVAEFSAVNGAKDKKRYTNVNPLEKAAYVADVPVPACVTLDEFNQVQRKLDQKKRVGRKPAMNYKRTGWFTCGNCGRSLIGAKRRNQLEYVCWASKQPKQVACSGPGPKRKGTSEDELERLLEAACDFLQHNKRFHEKMFHLTVAVHHLQKKKISGKGSDKKALLETRKKRLSELTNLFINEGFDGHEEIRKLTREVQSLQNEVSVETEESETWSAMIERLRRAEDQKSPMLEYLILIEACASKVVDGGSSIGDVFEEFWKMLDQKKIGWDLASLDLDGWKSFGLEKMTVNWELVIQNSQEHWIAGGITFTFKIFGDDTQFKYIHIHVSRLGTRVKATLSVEP